MVKRALGLMSGTSMDGIDVALIETDGEASVTFGATGYRPYAEGERDVLRAALAAARGVADRSARPQAMLEAEDVVDAAHAAVIREFLARNDLSADDIDVVGYHGQTVFHAPERRLTIQLGNGGRLARETGIPVVYDLRADDVAAGGEGAPLVPVFHRALVRSAGLEPPVAVLNLGGVANVTWIGAGPDDLIAFDTGPANALLDDFVRQRTGAAMDEGGRLASAGKVDETLLARWLDNPYFARPAPKSLDRDAFATPGLEALSVEDGAATLTAFTAASIAGAMAHLPQMPKLLIAAGGGAHNPVLLDMIARRTGLVVKTAAELGWDGDFVEAQAFAYLAVRALAGQPITFPGTTGIAEPMTGGRAVRP